MPNFNQTNGIEIQNKDIILISGLGTLVKAFWEERNNITPVPHILTMKLIVGVLKIQMQN